MSMVIAVSLATSVSYAEDRTPVSEMTTEQKVVKFNELSEQYGKDAVFFQDKNGNTKIMYTDPVTGESKSANLTKNLGNGEGGKNQEAIDKQRAKMEASIKANHDARTAPIDVVIDPILPEPIDVIVEPIDTVIDPIEAPIELNPIDEIDPEPTGLTEERINKFNEVASEHGKNVSIGQDAQGNTKLYFTDAEGNEKSMNLGKKFGDGEGGKNQEAIDKHKTQLEADIRERRQEFSTPVDPI